MNAIQEAIAFEAGNPRQRAHKWMAENPDVFGLFERYALALAGKGRKFGIKLLCERVRWDCVFEYAEMFKINNNYAPYIARELVKRHPELRPLMKFRQTHF